MASVGEGPRWWKAGTAGSGSAQSHGRDRGAIRQAHVVRRVQRGQSGRRVSPLGVGVMPTSLPPALSSGLVPGGTVPHWHAAPACLLPSPLCAEAICERSRARSAWRQPNWKGAWSARRGWPRLPAAALDSTVGPVRHAKSPGARHPAEWEITQAFRLPPAPTRFSGRQLPLPDISGEPPTPCRARAPALLFPAFLTAPSHSPFPPDPKAGVGPEAGVQRASQSPHRTRAPRLVSMGAPVSF